jgi:FtsH-binding integral membrane protein
MRRVLSWFAFSLLVIGGVLAYEVYRVTSDPERFMPQWQLFLLIAGAIACLLLGMIGLAERHRRRRDRHQG